MLNQLVHSIRCCGSW